VAAPTLAVDATAATAQSPVRSFVASAACGAAQRLAKEVLLHPIDTVRCRLELQGASRSLLAPGLFDDLYAGVLPTALVGVPSGALFFAAKDSAKVWLKPAMGKFYSKELSTVLAVLLAQFPYWLARTPAELLKTRAQLGQVPAGVGALESARRIVDAEGPGGLFVGLGPNIAYAAPTDVVKFAVYDSIKRRAKSAKGGELSPLEAAVCGAIGSAIAQATCTPLDVVRTRVIAAQRETDETGDDGVAALTDARDFSKVCAKLYSEEGIGALFAGLLPRVSRAFASGGIQFGAYEATRQLFGVTDKD
jgi:solute carrier family 25 S-adenosylmethionine transporter 26